VQREGGKLIVRRLIRQVGWGIVEPLPTFCSIGVLAFGEHLMVGCDDPLLDRYERLIERSCM
ncbi:MAG TPA: hypothetical protein VEZ90_00470, partial [Blastocatellia bacterium]|nr:hypothetical protein [Blastocatellia bacterium]